ncbi:hypothetical protein IWZ03DRAFT_365870 [Phyllosticta citriasiana]|uniref:Uncharacterized protein n=1 Tax=Phyllosticta citriasiana TaxID=595635 RepID=A0ABR1KYI0_9PEZI
MAGTARIHDHVLRLSRLVRRAALPAVSSIASLSGRLTLHLAPLMRGRSIGSGGTRGEVLLSRLLSYKMQSARARGHKASRRQPATPKKLRKLLLILRPESPVRHDDVGDVVADQLAKRVDVAPAPQRVRVRRLAAFHVPVQLFPVVAVVLVGLCVWAVDVRQTDG